MDFKYKVDPVYYNDEQRYVGFMSTPLYETWMRHPTLIQARKAIEYYLDQSGLGYVHVTDRSIWSAMDTVFKGYTPIRGDIFTHFNTVGTTVNEFELLMKRTIELIVSSIRFDIHQQNIQNDLNIWDGLLGDFNRHGLNHSPPIKLNKKRVPFMFNNRY